jgi:hypothetical protein
LNILWVKARLPPISQLLRCRVATERQPLLVDELTFSTGIGHPNGDGNRIRQVMKILLTPAQPFFIVFAVGDIESFPQNVLESPIRIVQWLKGGIDHNIAAAVVTKVEIVADRFSPHHSLYHGPGMSPRRFIMMNPGAL